MSATSGNALFREILDEFSQSLHSALPLRNVGEFHDGLLLSERAEKMGKRTLAKFSRKQTNLNVIEMSLLCKKLGERIKDLILKLVQKNQKHRDQSELFMQKRVDVLSEDFHSSVGTKLSLEPDMGLDELKTFIENSKQRIFVLYDEFLKPGDAQFQSEYKKILEEKLDALQNEVLERQRTSSDETDSAEESVPSIDSGNEEDLGLDMMEPQILAVIDPNESVELLTVNNVNVDGGFDEEEQAAVELQNSNDGLLECDSVPMESRIDIDDVDLDFASASDPPTMDGPYDFESPEGVSDDNFDEDNIRYVQIDDDDDDDESCSLRIIQIQGNNGAQRNQISPSVDESQSSSSGQAPANITIIRGGSRPLYYCKVCRSRFTRNAYLVRHGNSCSENKAFMCPNCDRGFVQKRHYENHIRTHADDDHEKPYKCPKCRKRFATRVNMQKHLHLSHHFSGSYLCKECKISFSKPIDLHEHNSLNHKNKLPFACNYCDSRFSAMEHLKAHVISHSGERPYTCPICKTPFVKKMLLVLHIRNVHRQSNDTANQLSREAAIEYFRKNQPNTGNAIPYSRINSVVLSLAIKKANLKLS